MRTSEGWARRVRSIDDASPIFHDILAGVGPLEHVVASPKAAAEWEGAGERIFVLNAADLLIADSPDGGPPRVRRVLFANLRRVQWARILLQSWIALDDGEDEVRLPHNAAVEPLFAPVLERARLGMSGVTSGGRFGGNPALDYLVKAAFKFHSYADMNVSADTVVRDTVFQPEIRERYYGFLERIKVPNQLLILTDKELIHIAEEAAPPRFFQARSPYGAITDIMPLSRIREATLEHAADPALLTLRVHLDLGADFIRPVSAADGEGIARLVELIGA